VDAIAIVFHLIAAYDIRRHAGVEIGKRKFLDKPVEF
jgi:hypothetical protein